MDIGATGEWDDAGATQPKVLFDGSEYHMWYIGNDGDKWRIGYATSSPAVSISDNNHTVPKDVYLNQNYPNPFNPTTSLEYSIKENAFMSLKIYTIRGKLVKTLVNEAQSAGVKQVSWDGTNDNNEHVSSGVYVYRIEAKTTAESRQNIFTSSKKMILLR